MAGPVPAPGPLRRHWPWMAVLAVVLIAPFLMPPLMVDRRPSPENSAIGSCRTYCCLQSMYRRKDRDGDGKLEYAHPYTQLNAPPGEPAGSTEDPFLRGEPKRGYRFRDMETIGGQTIDWEKDCALCATPVEYGVTGRRTFIVATNGTVFGKDLGGSEFVRDYPQDPGLEGWAIAE